MKLTVPRVPGAVVSRPARQRRLRRGARVQATVERVYTGRLRLVRIGGRRLLLQSDGRSSIGESHELEVIAVHPIPRFRHLASGRIIWAIPWGRSHRTRVSNAHG